MDREILRKIRALRKLKKQSQKKTKLRRELNKKIRDLKKLSPQEVLTPEKQALIDKIKTIQFYPIDLKQYTIKQLQFHLTKLKEKGLYREK